MRLIYYLAVEGRRAVEIAQILNAQGIPSPSSYKVRNGWNNMWTQVIDPDYRFWTNGVVRKLIMNEVYIGKAVSNKLKVTEPGKNHTAPRPKDEWIVVSGAHEPLVSESDFQKSQLILPKKKYHCKPEHIFGNKVKCPDCGHAMIRYTQQNPRFKCGTAKFTSHYGCKSHNILQSDIEKVVLAAVRAYAASQIDREELNLAVMERDSILVRELESRILEEEKAIKVIESSITKLYISLAEEEISEDAYIHKKSIINETLSRKRDALDRMRELHKTMRDKIAVADSAVTELTPLVSIESLDSEVVSLLIDRILVHGENDIEIVWNDKF